MFSSERFAVLAARTAAICLSIIYVDMADGTRQNENIGMAVYLG